MQQLVVVVGAMMRLLVMKFALNDVPHALGLNTGIQHGRSPKHEEPHYGNPQTGYYRLAAKGVPAMYMFLYISERGGTPAQVIDFLDFPLGYANEFVGDMRKARIGDYNGAFQVLQANGLVVGRSTFRNIQEIISMTTLPIGKVIDLVEKLHSVGHLQRMDKPFSLVGEFAPILGLSQEEFMEARTELVKKGVERIPPEFKAYLPPPKTARKTGELYYLSPKGISFMEFLGDIMEDAEALITPSWLSELIQSGVTIGPKDHPGTDLDGALMGFQVPVSSFSTIGLSAMHTYSAVYPSEVYNEINTWTGGFFEISIKEFVDILERAVRLNLLYRTDVGIGRRAPAPVAASSFLHRDNWTGKEYGSYEEMEEEIGGEIPPDKAEWHTYTEPETGKLRHSVPYFKEVFPGRISFIEVKPTGEKVELSRWWGEP